MNSKLFQVASFCNHSFLIQKSTKLIFSSIMILLTVALVSGCNPKLAEINGQTITKKDLTYWMDQFYPNKRQQERIWGNVNYQKNLVRHLAVIEMLNAEAKKAGYDKDKEFAQLWGYERQRYLMSLYNKEFSENMKSNKEYDIPVVRARHILFKVPSHLPKGKKNVPVTKKEKDKLYADALKKAQKVHGEIRDGGDFSALAKKYSDCPSKSKGGDLGYFTRKNMMVEPFSAAAFAMNPGQVSNPVKTRFGYHLILVDKKENVTPQTIKTIFPNTHQQKRFEQNISRLNMEAQYDKMKKSASQLLTLENINNAKPKDIVFKSSDMTLSLEEYKKMVRYYFRIQDDKADIPERTIGHSVDYLNRMFLFNQKAKKAKFTQRDWVQSYIKRMRERFLATQFLNKMKKDNISEAKISDQELKQEYQRRYARQLLSKKRKGNVPAFEKVKDNLKRSLKQRKENQFVRQWIDNKMKEYNYKVFAKNFEAKKKEKPKPKNPPAQQPNNQSKTK